MCKTYTCRPGWHKYQYYKQMPKYNYDRVPFAMIWWMSWKDTTKSSLRSSSVSTLIKSNILMNMVISQLKLINISRLIPRYKFCFHMIDLHAIFYSAHCSDLGKIIYMILA